jgi:hypothetical protein
MSSPSMGGVFLPDSDQTITGNWTFSTVPTYTGLGTQVTTSATQTLTNKTLTTPVLNGTPTGTMFVDRTIKTAILALTGAAIHAGTGGVIAWTNPESTAILILRAIVDLTTVSTGACTLDIGLTETSATTTSDTLLDGIDAAAGVAVFDSMDAALDGGANAKAQKLAAAKWVTVDEKSGDATGLVGNLYLQYVLI